jgi:hypothetical protein
MASVDMICFSHSMGVQPAMAAAPFFPFHGDGSQVGDLARSV